MRIVNWIACKLGYASSTKLVTHIGLLLTALSAVCLQLGDEWLGSNIGIWTHKACGISVFLGALITALGKGLADRRGDNGRAPLPPMPEEAKIDE